MLISASVLLTLAVLGGVLLASLHLRDDELPFSLALSHGGAAAAGLIALAVGLSRGAEARYLELSFGLFIVAALGGFYLFSYHLRGHALPSPVVGVHAAVAAAASTLLLLSAAGAV